VFWCKFADLQKRKCANFLHYESANKLPHKRNIDRYSLENRNNGLRNRKLDFTRWQALFTVYHQSGGVYVHLLLTASCKNEYRK